MKKPPKKIFVNADQECINTTFDTLEEAKRFCYEEEETYTYVRVSPKSKKKKRK